MQIVTVIFGVCGARRHVSDSGAVRAGVDVRAGGLQLLATPHARGGRWSGGGRGGGDVKVVRRAHTTFSKLKYVESYLRFQYPVLIRYI